MREDTDCKTKDKEVLKEALKPHQEEDAYLGVLYNSARTTIAAASKDLRVRLWCD